MVKRAMVRTLSWVLGASGMVPALATYGPGSEFTRVVESDDGLKTSLEMSIRAYEQAGGKGPTVYLVGAVHVGDLGFYQELQRFLDAQDVVLFEGVGEPGQARDARWDLPRDDEVKAATTRARARFLASLAGAFQEEHGRAPESLVDLGREYGEGAADLIVPSFLDAWGRAFTFSSVTTGAGEQVSYIASLGSDGALGGEGAASDVFVSPSYLGEPPAGDKRGEGIQQKLADALGLQFQLAAMNHDAPNWRNSDVSVDVVIQRLKERGAEGESEMLFSALSGEGFMGKLSGFLLGLVGRSATLRESTKAMMVDLLASAEDMMAMQGEAFGPLMDVILHERNEVVLRDLQEVLREEPEVRTIAIIYGAGHLPGLEEALTGRLGFAPGGQHWVRAMTADLGKAGMSKAQAQRMRDMIKRQMERQLKRGR